MLDSDLKIYTDGSSYSGPRLGGFAFRFVYNDTDTGNEITKDFQFPSYKGATNNQMELKACIEALKQVTKFEGLDNFDGIVILTDSLYIVNNYKKALYEWPRTKWKRFSGAPVQNADQWKELVNWRKKLWKRVEIVWVKGHSKDPHNKAVDKMAKQSAKKPSREKLNIVDVRRKLSPNRVQLGSVEMKGQRIAIRIITGQRLKIHKLYKYKYEVISEGSKYYNKVDVIHSKIHLKSGHSYLVTVNKNQGNPMILKIITEIKNDPKSIKEELSSSLVGPVINSEII